MKPIICISVLLTLWGCSMGSKSSDEMEKISEQVLKKGEGIEIEFKPIPVEKSK